MKRKLTLTPSINPSCISETDSKTSKKWIPRPNLATILKENCENNRQSKKSTKMTFRSIITRDEDNSNSYVSPQLLSKLIMLLSRECSAIFFEYQQFSEDV